MTTAGHVADFWRELKVQDQLAPVHAEARRRVPEWRPWMRTLTDALDRAERWHERGPSDDWVAALIRQADQR